MGLSIDNYIINNIANKSSKQIAKDLKCSSVTVLKKAHQLGFAELLKQKTIDSQFKKGNISFNKGKKRIEFMSAKAIKRSEKTQFKKGNLPVNTKTDFAISVRKSKGTPYYYIRIALNKWILLHRYLWEMINGKIPKNYNVQFKDNNSLNICLENLYIIDKKYQVRHNQKGVKNYEIKKVITDIYKLENKIREYEK